MRRALLLALAAVGCEGPRPAPAEPARRAPVSVPLVAVDAGERPAPRDAGAPSSDAGVWGEPCQIIRALPDSRLRISVGGVERNLRLRGVAPAPPSVRFAQLIARAATKPRVTRCLLQGDSVAIQVERWAEDGGSALEELTALVLQARPP